MKRVAAPLSPADRVRYQLLLAGLSQQAAARALGLNVRTMRKYCGGGPVPLIFDYALKGLIAEKHGMKL